MIQKILVANWKMNPQTLAEAKALALEVKKLNKSLGETRVVIAPPALYIGEVSKVISKTKIELGAQNVSSEKEGAQTGENSAGMLKDAGVSVIIVGHSECRAKGESDDMINKKVLAVTGLSAVALLCVGESSRDEEGHYLEFLGAQLVSGLKGLQVKSLKNLMIAYEPIWAIGANAKRAMLPSELHEMSIFIRKTLINLYGKAVAYKVPVLYGGSVDEKNANLLLAGGAIDGFLVGRASLSADTFGQLLATTKATGVPKIVKL